MLFYLSEDFEGGETRFVDDPDLGPEPLTVAPKVGRMLSFRQGRLLYHAGLPVRGEGSKYVLRTDVFYRF